MPKNILIADDHDVVRQGIRSVLRTRSGWKIIDEAENGVEAIAKTQQLAPDLLLLDISMPEKDGLEVVHELTAAGTKSKILVLTMHESKELAARVRASGAAGFLTKTSVGRDLIPAIQAIFDGGTFFPLQATKL